MTEMNNTISNNGQIMQSQLSPRDFDSALSPRERLMQLANLSSVVDPTELGIGYHEGKDGRSELIFSQIASLHFFNTYKQILQHMNW